MQIEPVPLTKEQHEEIKDSVKETVEVDQLHQAEMAIAKLDLAIKDLRDTSVSALDMPLVMARLYKVRQELFDYILYNKFKKVS